MTLTSLFSQKSDQRLDALRSVCKENATDIAWRSSFGAKAKDLEAAAHEAEFAMRADPSVESVSTYLKARVKFETEGAALGGVEAQIGKVCGERLTARTRPALKDALACLIERLETERDAILERDKQSAAAFGLETHDVESPVLGRVSGALTEARSWLARVDAMEFPQMRDAIKACIGTEV